MPKEIAQRLSWIDLAPIHLAIDGHGNVPHPAHGGADCAHQRAPREDTRGLSTSYRLVFALPGRQARGVATRGPAPDEAFCQVAAGNVEMAENAAQLACREQPGN